MNETREPTVFDFTPRQARMMREVSHKMIGQIIRGVKNIALARELVAIGMVSVKDLEKGGPGLIVTLTPIGREAWYNFGQRAAGHNPICL